MNKNGNTPAKLSNAVRQARPSRGLLFGVLILGALVAFEIFNYSTTDFALNDLLGGLSFASVRWATILAIAFCGIDFAGLARLFTPERGNGEPKEVWYLFGAWLLAATMNAILTWWGVAIAILSHESLGGTVIPRETMLKVVPVFVAIMVWVIRVLIIGSFSVTGSACSASRLPRTAPHRRWFSASPSPCQPPMHHCPSRLTHPLTELTPNLYLQAWHARTHLSPVSMSASQAHIQGGSRAICQ
jgi:hypothetical protein